jgi:WD40 repeat protein
MRQPFDNEQDRETLDKIERILTSEEGDERETDSLYGLAARLAATVPQADDDFRADLLARLHHEMGHAHEAAHPAAYPRHQAGSLAPQNGIRSAASTPASKQPARPRLAGPARLIESLRPIIGSLRPERGKRFVAATMGLVGVAAMLLLFVGMIAMFRIRQDQMSRGGFTPTPAAVAPIDTLKLASAMQPLRTINTGSLSSMERGSFMEWSSDGRILATAQQIREEWPEVIGEGGEHTITIQTWEVKLWDVASTQLIGSRTVENVYVTTMSMSPDGQILAIGLQNNTILLLNARTAGELHTLTGPLPDKEDVRRRGFDDRGLGWVTSISWSPDGSALASAAGDSFGVDPIIYDGAIRVWDAKSGTLTRTIRVTVPEGSQPAQMSNVARFTGWTSTVDWSPDGRALASLSSDGSTRIWDASTGAQLHQLTRNRPPEDSYPSYLAWSPDGQTLAVVTGRLTELWHAANGTFLRVMPESLPPTPMPTIPPRVPDTPQVRETPAGIDPHENYPHVYGLAWSPDGQTLATWGGSDILRLWDPATGAILHTITSRTSKAVWSSDSRVLTSIDGVPAPDAEGGKVTLWNPVSGSPVRVIFDTRASDFAWSPNGDILAVRTGTIITLWGAGPEVLPTNTPESTTPLPATTITTISNCGSWTILPSPNGGQINVLQSVDALSPDSAWAVGYYSNATVQDIDAGSTLHEGAGTRTLIQRWDGTRWTLVPSPNVGPGSNYLRSIVAITENDAWAVGFYTTTNNLERTLITHWDGTEWRVIPSPNAGDNVDNRLASISAVSSSDIWAVGSYGDNPVDLPVGDPARTLIMHWDGAAWKIVPSPNPSQYVNRLYAVEGLSEKEAWAVGYQLLSPTGDDWQILELVLHWNDVEWSVEPGPQYATPEGLIQHNLVGVAAADSSVWAVGSARGREGTLFPLILNREAGTWSSRSVPIANPVLPTQRFHLAAIDAISANDLWAVGGYYPSAGTQGEAQTYALHYNGAAWGVVPSPNVMGEASELLGVSAIGANDVWAVGYSGPHTAHKTLIMRFTGPPCEMMPEGAGTPLPTSSPASTPVATMQPPPTPSPPPVSSAPDCGLTWSVVPVPTSSPTSGDGGRPFTDVAAISPADIWTVGYEGTVSSTMLVAHWAGSEWSTVAVPATGNADNKLYGVTARDPNDVWAVGSYGNGPTDSKPLTMHWDGAAWTVVPAADPGPGLATLHAVVAVAPNDAWAVGTYSSSNELGSAEVQARSQTLIEHWDGNQWSIVPSPSPGTLRNTLDGLAVVSEDDIWAVGSYEQEQKEFLGVGKTLALHWDGKRWAHVETPNVQAWINVLSDVDALAADDIWAVGSTNGGEHLDPLAMHWDGTEWSIVPAPRSASHNGGSLSAVAALSPNDVWAAGGDGVPTAMHWNGNRWEAFALDGLNEDDRIYYGWLDNMVALSPTSIWAVGAVQDVTTSGNTPKALSMHYGDVPCATPGP